MHCRGKCNYLYSVTHVHSSLVKTNGMAAAGAGRRPNQTNNRTGARPRNCPARPGRVSLSLPGPNPKLTRTHTAATGFRPPSKFDRMRVTTRPGLAAPVLIAGAETTADLAPGTTAEGHVGRHAGLRLGGLWVLFLGVSHALTAQWKKT